MDCLLQNESAKTDLRIVAVWTFSVLNLSVFVLYAFSVWRYGDLFATTGGEPLTVFPIWKGLHHRPLYQWPLKFPFSLGLYNYLFYETYILFLRLVRARDTQIMLWGRMLTMSFALLGAAAQWKLVQAWLRLRGARSWLSFLLAASLWLSTSMGRQWALSIRTDVGAAAWVMIGLMFLVWRPPLAYLWAGLAFYLAWSFKQSEVLALTGACLSLTFRLRWRALFTMTAVFACLAAATLLVGTPEYRYNILVAPRLIGWSLGWAARIVPKALAANAYWLLAPIALQRIRTTGRRNDQELNAREPDTVPLLLTVFGVALVGGMAGMVKVGAWNNYLFEAFVAGSTLLQMAVFAVPGRLAGSLLLFGCVQPALQLVTLPSGARPHPFGTVGIATSAEYAEAVALRGRMALMAKPIFTTDEQLALPWFSSDEGATPLVIDAKFHEATRSRCPNGCVEGMLTRGEVPTVMLANSDTDYQQSLSSSYQRAGEAPYAGRLWSIYTLRTRSPNAGQAAGQ